MAKNIFISCLIILLVFPGISLYAQKPRITGKVQDSRTYKPVSFANITLSRTKAGCITDQDGNFSIVTDSLPVYMIISHIGYETQRVWLEKSSVASGISILLEPSVQTLKEVEIRSVREPVPFFKDEEYSILDFEVDNTLVYLLVYRFRLAKAQLICLSDRGDTVATSSKLSFRPTGLYSDCLGYLHIISQDTAYQVYLKKDTIIFPYHTEITRFFSKMMNCVASSDDWLYVRKESPDHLRIDFYRIHRKTKKLENITSSTDDLKRKMLRLNPIDYYLLMMDTLPNSASEIAEYNWVRKILYTPNVSQLRLINDTVAVFNTTDGSMELFDKKLNFLTLYDLPVMDRRTEKWTREIFYDDMTGQVFTTFYKNGKVYVYNIGLSTGKLTLAGISNHIFPGKIIIDNNDLYYLYDLPGLGDNKHLFRQDL